MSFRLRVTPFLASAALLFSAAWATPGRAQETTGRIQGSVVTEGTQRPLQGAQVYIEGTQIGGLTNDQGRYVLLNVPAGTHIVRVQTLGYAQGEQTVTVVAGEAATANFNLSETAVALDEIVVTGTAAVVRKKEIGNSIATVSAQEIQNAPVSNPQQILAGRAPGVTIMTNSGQPGAGGTIKIRGTNSVSQDTEPLIYVDGVRIFNEPTRAGWGGRGIISPLQDIAAEDIERIEVVKGAAATTLYGTEASSGVVQIFTKKGIAGQTLWNAEAGVGFAEAARWGTGDDPTSQYIKCGNIDELYGLDLSGDGQGEKVKFEDPTCPEDGDWGRRGAMQHYNLSVRGGSEKLTYFLSGNLSNDDGFLPTQNSRDGGFRGNFSFSPINQVTITLNNAYTHRKSRFLGDGNNSEGFLLNVGRGPAGYMKGGKGDDCAAVPADKICATNGYVFDGQFFTTSDHYTSGLTVNYTPVPKFNNRLTVGYDYTDIGNETTLPFAYLTLPEGYYWDESTRHTKVSVDYAGSFGNDFGESLESTFSWGGQIFRDRHRWTEFDVQGFAGPGEPTLESGAELTYRADDPIAETNAGVFLQEQLAWKDRLFLTGGLRVDGNSAFGDDFGLQPYPKFSASYVLSDYDFWPAWWETMKLRAAVGESGKAPAAFDKVRTWSPVSSDGQPGFTPGDIGNDEVGPERTREIEAGFDASWFDGRLGMEFTAFHQKTFDALVGVTYPPSAGFLASRAENVGSLRNKGLELGLTLNPIRTSALDWRVRFNGSLFSSEALDLDNGRPDTTSIYTGLNSSIKEGYPVPMYFGLRIMNPDEIAAPIIVEDTTLGRVYPNKLLGIGTTITLFNNLTIDALAEYQGGHTVQNYTGYQSARRGAWHPCFATQEKLIQYDQTGDASVLSGVKAIDRARCAIASQPTGDETSGYDIAFWTEKADFLKMRYISLTYQLPSRFVNFAKSASITLAGRNLFMITDYTGADPEVEDGADRAGNVTGGGEFGRRDYYQIPPARSFLMSLRVSF